MPLLKAMRNVADKQLNVKFIEELKAMSDEDLELMASSAPGMSNVYVQAEVERRKKEKEKE